MDSNLDSHSQMQLSPVIQVPSLITHSWSRSDISLTDEWRVSDMSYRLCACTYTYLVSLPMCAMWNWEKLWIIYTIKLTISQNDQNHVFFSQSYSCNLTEG
jgi:hypothetical protein